MSTKVIGDNSQGIPNGGGFAKNEQAVETDGASCGATTIARLSSGRTRYCSGSRAWLSNVVQVLPGLAMKLLSVIFEKKNEVEEENHKNRWARDEIRLVPQEFQAPNSNDSGYHTVTGVVSKRQRV
jgi:hypothetical protein